jgi:hypothetical protein
MRGEQSHKGSCAQLYRMYTDYTDPIGLIKIGFLILIAVVSFPTENPLIISSVILIAALVLGFSYGIQLDDQNGTFRQFKSFLGFKYGPWQSLRDFDSIYILKRTIRSSSNAGFLVATSSTANEQFELYISDNSQLKRILIKTFKSEDGAKALAKRFEEKFKLKLTVYQPTLSQKSQLRKKRRSRN